MIYKAVEVIWIFLADTRSHGPTHGRTEVFKEVLANLKRGQGQKPFIKVIKNSHFLIP